MRFLPVFVAALLLAGCSDPENPANGSETDANPDPLDTGAAPNGSNVPSVPVTFMVPIEQEGTLGSAAVVCEFTHTGRCVGNELTEDTTDVLYEHPGATLTGASLTLTWSPTSPATDTLAIGLMRMGTNSTFLDGVEGTSPLTLELSDVGLLLDEGNLVHIFVYNARGNLIEDPVMIYASLDQPVRLEGSLTLQAPAGE